MESVKSRLRAARDSYKNGDFAETVRRCESVLDSKKDSYEACLLLGKAAFSLEDHDKAESSYVRGTEINPSAMPAWQGLAEVYEKMDSYESAVWALRTLAELSGEDEAKCIVFSTRLADALVKSDQRDEAEETLQKILKRVGLSPETRLMVLCHLADIQMAHHEAALEERVQEVLGSKHCTIGNREECEPGAVRTKVMGEYMEEALQANSPVCSTLKEIVEIAPPYPAHVKYHETYLLMYCKAIYCAEAQSVHRYNLRLQALERCYKMIHGKSGGCCSPMPFLTALRLLEINEEALGGQKAVGGQEVGSPEVARRESLTSSAMFQSFSSSLHELPAASDPDMTHAHRKTSVSRFTHSESLKIKITQPFPQFNAPDTPSMVGQFSSELTVESHGDHAGFSSITRMSSGSVTLAPVLESVKSGVLPRFMRSSSLTVVRKLHKLGSGVLSGMEDVIGGNTPLLLEVTEKIGCRLMHMFPWEGESGVQLGLALRRRKAKSKTTNETPSRMEYGVTYLAGLPKNRVSLKNGNWNEAMIRLFARGLKLGSRSAATRIAIVELYLEESKLDEALDVANEGLDFLERRQLTGGYPMTQAVLTLKLLAGRALLRLGKLDDAEHRFHALADGVSEGESSFGWMAGSSPTSIRQAAQRGLAHVSLARGDKITAMQRYEEVLGAGLMGKASIEPWANAEYGWMLYQNGDTVRAKSHLEKALVAVKGSNAPMSNMGEYLYKLGQVYWSLGKKWKSDRSFAQTHFMQAAKTESDFQAGAFTMLGRFYLEVELDKQKARKCFQRALALDPTQGYAGNALFALLESGGTSPEKLRAFCQEMLRRDSSALWALEGDGRAAYSSEDYPAAVTAFKTVLKKKLENASLWERIGAAYQGMGRVTASLKSFNRAIELEPNRLFSLVQAGRLNAQIGEHQESLERFSQALEVDENYPPALLGMAETLVGSCKDYLKLGVLGLAAEYAERARVLVVRCAKFHGNLKAVWKLLGDIDFLHHAMPPTRIKEFDKNPLGEEGIPAAGAAFVEKAREDAKESFSRVKLSRRAYAHALHLDPREGGFWGDVAAAAHQESLLEGKKEQSESSNGVSERLLRGGLQLNPTSVHLWEALGKCGKSPEVREYALNRALQLNPKRVEAWVALAKLYQEFGQRGLADKCFEQARSHDPSSVLIWEGMASLSAGLPDLPNSCPSLDQYEHGVGLGGSPHSFLGFALNAVRLGHGEEPEVYACARKAVVNFPLNPAAHNALGICEEARGSLGKAVSAFEAALAIVQFDEGAVPENGVVSGVESQAVMVRVNLARVLCKIGRRADGMSIFDKLEKEGELESRHHALVSFAQAKAEDGDLEGALSILTNVISGECDGLLKIDVIELILRLHVKDSQLVKAGKVLTDFVDQTLNTAELQREVAARLPETFLTLLAGALISESHELVHEITSRAMECAWKTGVADSHLVSQILVLRYFGFGDAGNHRVARRFLSHAVRMAPWNIDAHAHLSDIALRQSREGFGNIGGWTTGVAYGVAAKNPKLLRVKEQVEAEILRTKMMIRDTPSSAKWWYLLAILEFHAALYKDQSSRFRKAESICNIALKFIENEENIEKEPPLETFIYPTMRLRLFTVLSECWAKSRTSDSEEKALRWGNAALELAIEIGPDVESGGEAVARRQLGRIFLMFGKKSEGEGFLKEAVERGDGIAVLELAVLYESEGKVEEAKQLLARARGLKRENSTEVLTGHPILDAGKSDSKAPEFEFLQSAVDRKWHPLLLSQEALILSRQGPSISAPPFIQQDRTEEGLDLICGHLLACQKGLDKKDYSNPGVVESVGGYLDLRLVSKGKSSGRRGHRKLLVGQGIPQLWKLQADPVWDGTIMQKVIFEGGSASVLAGAYQEFARRPDGGGVWYWHKAVHVKPWDLDMWKKLESAAPVQK
ncbi:hypothetical protein BSKO_13429 [Bryopsis sp. KO-2023]|nr:hypothetical protein BSKO_13429 [Bryopsis sp. KO-2023]